MQCSRQIFHVWPHTRERHNGCEQHRQGRPAPNHARPGTLANTTYNIDGNTASEYDMTTMAQTLSFTSATGTAFLSFDWNFPTSEQDQPNQYDDVFDIVSTIGATSSPLLTGSSCKNDNASYSPYPNVPCFTSTVLNWTIVNASPITNTSLRYGIGQFQHACVAIPNVVAGSNTMTLTIRVGDQSDNQYDSVLLLDNIAIVADCTGGTGDTTVNKSSTVRRPHTPQAAVVSVPRREASTRSISSTTPAAGVTSSTVRKVWPAV